MDHTYVVYYEHISEQYEYPLARVPLTTSFYTNQQINARYLYATYIIISLSLSLSLSLFQPVLTHCKCIETNQDISRTK